jgi:hypothetical protein
MTTYIITNSPLLYIIFTISAMTEPPALGGPISSNDATNPAGAISAIAGQQQGQQDDPDVWIAQLMQCKPLSEAEVKRLCDKVST